MDGESKESRTKLCLEIINLTMYLNHRWTSGTEDSITSCNISKTERTMAVRVNLPVSTHENFFKCVTRQDRKSTNVVELDILFFKMN